MSGRITYNQARRENGNLELLSTVGRGPYQYKTIRDKSNPRNHNGRVCEHIAVAERILRRPLPLGAAVHHVNENTLDNRPSNLVICESNAYHKLIHRRMRALRCCGYAWWIQCRICKQYDDPSNLYIRTKTIAGHGFHRVCHAKYEKARLERKRNETKPGKA